LYAGETSVLQVGRQVPPFATGRVSISSGLLLCWRGRADLTYRWFPSRDSSPIVIVGFRWTGEAAVNADLRRLSGRETREKAHALHPPAQ
jgi:hypothetical protein